MNLLPKTTIKITGNSPQKSLKMGKTNTFYAENNKNKIVS